MSTGLRRPKGEGMMEGTVEKPPVSRRRIIERPRLTRLLDDSPARIKMLVAPAGYGKTTLARQWLGNREASWFTCGPEAADVAALAAGLAVALSRLESRAGVTLLERLHATDHPAREVDVLGELLVEDLTAWNSDGWLMVDDYQYVSESPAAEMLFAELASTGDLNLFVCGRQRPSWATARRVIYGEILVIGRSELAMRSDEARDLFDSHPQAQDVLERAQGWPAIVSLATASGVRSWAEDLLPATLYRFLAEEIFESLSGRARDALTLLAIAPNADTELARLVVAADYETVVAELIHAGMVDGTDTSGYQMHPLIRDFLLTKIRELTPDEQRQRAMHVLERLIDSSRWDDAFVVVSSFLPSEIERLTHAASRDLLSRARTQTLETWIQFATDAGVDGLALDLARAELAFREGAFVEALAGAELVARKSDSEDDQRGRALVLAGRAAHLASREAAALEWYGMAKTDALDENDRRAAAWGEIAAAIDLEQPNTADLLREMSDFVQTHSDIISLADKNLAFDSRTGTLRTLSEARGLVSTVDRVPDPLVRCSFRNSVAYSFALAGEYADSAAVCDALDDDVRTNRLDFVRPYLLATRAMCLSAGKRYEEAVEMLDSATHFASSQGNEHCRIHCAAIEARTHFGFGEFDRAVAALAREPDDTIPSMNSEFDACRALTLCGVSRYDDALVLVERALRTSSNVETRVLAAGVKAICAISTDPSRAPAAVRWLLAETINSRNVDCFATVYRGIPGIFGYAEPNVLLAASTILVRLGDRDLASTVAQLGMRGRPGVASLSPREMEVGALIAQGFSNKEIAAALFITPATAKLHVRHIFEKLDVRTRTAAALKLAAALDIQAAPESGSST